jgi:hypothetical protein
MTRHASPADLLHASLADANLLLVQASVFRSDLVALPPDRFRMGFGHAGVPGGLVALEAALR